MDKQFMDKLFELMERELSNPELNIMRLSNHLKMGRAKLYYKIKGLKGETPNIFFNRYKLNRAVEMLKSGKFNVSEVADLTGFKTSSHFSTVFKKQFGVSPTKYL
jgi:AraC-like DNA-binding protein